MEKVINYEKLDKNGKFGLDTLCFSGYMAEDFLHNDFEELEKANGCLECSIGFLPNNTIKISEVSPNGRYAITYIQKDGSMLSLVNLKMLEVFSNLNVIAELIESENYINIYNMKDGLSYKEYKEKILKLRETLVTNISYGDVLLVRENEDAIYGDKFAAEVLLVDNISAGSINEYECLVVDLKTSRIVRDCIDIEDFKSQYTIFKNYGPLKYSLKESAPNEYLIDKYLKQAKEYLTEEHESFIGCTTELEVQESLDEDNRNIIISRLLKREEVMHASWTNDTTLFIGF